jgi:hypothetical protein
LTERKQRVLENNEKIIIKKTFFYRRASFSTEVLPSAEETVKTAHGEKVPLFYALYQTADDPMFFGIFKKPNSCDRPSF